MQKVLTDAYLRALIPPATGRLEISDTRCGGLVLRVTANGVKSWSFRFRDRTTQAPLRITTRKRHCASLLDAILTLDLQGRGERLTATARSFRGAAIRRRRSALHLAATNCLERWRIVT